MSAEHASATNLSRTLGRVGIWTRQLDNQPARVAQAIAGELEATGYRTLWIPEAIDREVISHAALLLAGTAEMVVATGVAITYAREARAAALAQTVALRPLRGPVRPRPRGQSPARGCACAVKSTVRRSSS